MFPWEVPQFVPIEFKCPYCGEIQPQSNGRLIVCTCPKAIQAEAENKQRIANWHRQVVEANQNKQV